MMDEYKKCMYNDIIYIYVCVYIYILRDQKTVNTDIFDIFGVCVCLKMVHRQFPWIGLSDNRFLASSLNRSHA